MWPIKVKTIYSFYLWKVSEFQYLRLDLVLPVFQIETISSEYDGENRVVCASFQTVIKYLSSRNDETGPVFFRMFTFQILGFGFNIIRQNGY